MLVSDLNDGIHLQSALVEVRTLVPDDMNVSQIDHRVIETRAAKCKLIECLNWGLGMVS